MIMKLFCTHLRAAFQFFKVSKINQNFDFTSPIQFPGSPLFREREAIDIPSEGASFVLVFCNHLSMASLIDLDCIFK